MQRPCAHPRKPGGRSWTGPSQARANGPSRNHADGNQDRQELRQDSQDEQDKMGNEKVITKWWTFLLAPFRSSILFIQFILSKISVLIAWIRLYFAFLDKTAFGNGATANSAAA